MLAFRYAMPLLIHFRHRHGAIAATITFSSPPDVTPFYAMSLLMPRRLSLLLLPPDVLLDDTLDAALPLRRRRYIMPYAIDMALPRQVRVLRCCLRYAIFFFFFFFFLPYRFAHATYAKSAADDIDSMPCCLMRYARKAI